MAIRFRCSKCQQLMSIASRKAGSIISCPACASQNRVPTADEESSLAARGNSESGSPAEQPPVSNAESWFSRPVGSTAEDEEPPRVTAHNKPVVSGAETARDNSEYSEYEEDDEGGISLRSPKTDFEDMDMTPMVDVTFLLLIFFMITAAFSLQKTIQIPPPDPEREGALQTVEQFEDLSQHSIRVEIDERNVVLVEDDPVGDLSQLADAIRGKSSADQKNELLLIPHSRALHETVVAVVDAAHEAGMQRIRLTSVTGGSAD